MTNRRIVLGVLGMIVLAGSGGRFQTRISRNSPIAADLRWRGFSASNAGVGQLVYDCERVSMTSPWKAITGQYTREGDVRALLEYAVEYSKEMNFSSATADQLTPLPFHGMRRYSYRREQRYPSSAAHLEYLARYNTRVVRRGVPLIETSAARALGVSEARGGMR